MQVSIGWLYVSAVLGCLVGMVVMALMVVAKDNKEL